MQRYKGECASFSPCGTEGKPKGFVIVNFTNLGMAHRCTSEMNRKELEGKVIFVGRAHRSARSARVCSERNTSSFVWNACRRSRA